MLQGTAVLDELTAQAAVMDHLDTEAVTIAEVEILQATFEIAVAGRQASLPPGLHPPNPPILVLQVWNCGDSPWGPFRLAQARVGARSGLRPRGFTQGCVGDHPTAVAELRRRWGFPARHGTVAWHRGYHAVEVEVAENGVSLTRLRGHDPEPLDPADVAYSTTVALAHTPRGLRLVQIDADVTALRAERLRPRLEGFARGAWTHPAVQPRHPVSASITTASLTIGRLRYLSRPDELAFSGTEPLEAR